MSSASMPVDDAVNSVHVPQLRICVMTDCAHGIGGMQRHTHDLVKGLVAAGHDVEAICPAHPTLDPHAHGARWHLVDTPGRTEKRWREKFRGAFLEAESRKRFDVVHSESTAAHGLFLKPRVDTPVVVKYHGNYLGFVFAHARRAWGRPTSAPREVRALVDNTIHHLAGGEAWGFRDCVSVVPARQQLRNTARSQFLRLQQLHVVPNGVDTTLFAPGDRRTARGSFGLGDGLILASVGRLNREKGFDVALAALAQIRRSTPGVRLLVIGDGERRDDLVALAQRLGVEGHTDFVGDQPPETVAEYLVASDIFLCPTRRDEAGPIVVTEAMACGLPVVASCVGGVPEMLQPLDGPQCGVLVRPDNVDELVAAIGRLVADESFRLSLGARARRRTLEEYTIETMTDRTVAVYRLAIARTQSAQ